MRYCILGDSHTAALNLGWERIKADFPSAAITIFAARGPAMGQLVAEGTDVVPGTMSLQDQMEYTSGREARVRTSEYDIFAICGMFLMPLWRQAGLSRSVITTANAEQFLSSVSGSVALLLRSVTQAPIYVMPKPLVAEEPDPPVDRTAPSYPEQIALLTRYFEREKLQFVCQPAETMPGGWSTSPVFSKNSSRLAVTPAMEGMKHPDRETGHMNAGYGALALSQFLKMTT